MMKPASPSLPNPVTACVAVSHAGILGTIRKCTSFDREELRRVAATKLLRVRLELKLSQERFAYRLGVSVAAIGTWERNEKTMPAWVAEAYERLAKERAA